MGGRAGGKAEVNREGSKNRDTIKAGKGTVAMVERNCSRNRGKGAGGRGGSPSFPSHAGRGRLSKGWGLVTQGCLVAGVPSGAWAGAARCHQRLGKGEEKTGAEKGGGKEAERGAERGRAH